MSKHQRTSIPGSIIESQNGPLTPSPDMGNVKGSGGKPQQNGPLTPSPDKGK